MPFMAMSDSITRSVRYPVQPTAIAGLGDDPPERFEESYEENVKRNLPYLIKHKAPPEFIEKIKSFMKQKRWQKAFDMIQFYFEDPKNPMLKYYPPPPPVAQNVRAPSIFSRSPRMSGISSCCSNCASGAPCCGHDHGVLTELMVSDLSQGYLMNGIIGGAAIGAIAAIAGTALTGGKIDWNRVAKVSGITAFLSVLYDSYRLRNS